MSDHDLVGLHRAMVMSRVVEEHCLAASPHWYGGVGEEAAVVGTFSQLERDDFAVPHYRGATIIPWLRGAPLAEVLNRAVQRRTSPTRGRLYGQFSGDLARKVMPYVTLALGPNLAVAVGLALASKRRGDGAVSLCSFGDGTAGTGEFHESLNLAAVLSAPVVFVCQNNGVAISTRARDALATRSVASWAQGYGLPCLRVDGNDVAAVSTAVRTAIDTCRVDQRPTFVETVTYRIGGHFRADPAAYQDIDETAEWQGRDPIRKLEQTLLDEHMCTPDQLTEARAACEAQVRDAAARIAADPPFEGSDLCGEEVFERGR